MISSILEFIAFLICARALMALTLWIVARFTAPRPEELVSLGAQHPRVWGLNNRAARPVTRAERPLSSL